MAIKKLLKEFSVVKGDVLNVSATSNEVSIGGKVSRLNGNLNGRIQMSFRLRGRYPTLDYTGRITKETFISYPLYLNRESIEFTGMYVYIQLHDVSSATDYTAGVDVALAQLNRAYKAYWGVNISRKLNGIVKDVLVGCYRFAG